MFFFLFFLGGGILAQAQCRPFHEVRQLVEKEIGNSLEEVFSSFEEQPFAAASLAQVHRAVLREGGQPVAVKVQYPGLEKDVTADVLTISFLLRMVEKVCSECDSFFSSSRFLLLFSWCPPLFVVKKASPPVIILRTLCFSACSCFRSLSLGGW